MVCCAFLYFRRPQQRIFFASGLMCLSKIIILKNLWFVMTDVTQHWSHIRVDNRWNEWKHWSFLNISPYFIIQMKSSWNVRNRWRIKDVFHRWESVVWFNMYLCMGCVSLVDGGHKSTSSEFCCHSNFELWHAEHKNSQRWGWLADYSEK